MGGPAADTSGVCAHGDGNRRPTTPGGGLTAAQQLVRDLHTARHPRRWTPALARDLVHGVLPAVRGVRELPVTVLELGTTGAGAAVRAHLAARRHGVTTARAVSVLVLPEEAAAYLRGRSRQSVRTSRTRAAALGVRSERVDLPELQGLARALQADGSSIGDLDLLLAEPDAPGLEHWVARDADGAVLAIARLLVDGRVAWLKYFVAVADGERSVARHQLASTVFVDLADRGVRHVLVGSAIHLGPGLVHMQKLLGFSATRVLVADRPTSPGVAVPAPRSRPGAVPAPRSGSRSGSDDPALSRPGPSPSTR